MATYASWIIASQSATMAPASLFASLPSYFAPEMVRGRSASTSTGGAGVLMYELATVTHTGATDSDDDVVLKRISAHTSGSLAVPQHVNHS